ncbi:hypothetical protein L915_03593 [Phytophthora nicotianae]|uniref:Uncharacterized protein n=1 Tax=Phytophthora nicotianae TaxID=4792 RepID=W2HDE3_PHYNI|nr:hypothetical protein L915_03593 [Phytophthora nicotianae]
MMKMMLILREETKAEAPEPMKNHAAATNLSLVMSAINPRRRKRKSIVARKVLREKNAFP